MSPPFVVPVVARPVPAPVLKAPPPVPAPAPRAPRPQPAPQPAPQPQPRPVTKNIIQPLPQSFPTAVSTPRSGLPLAPGVVGHTTDVPDDDTPCRFGYCRMATGLACAPRQSCGPHATRITACVHNSTNPDQCRCHVAFARTNDSRGNCVSVDGGDTTTTTRASVEFSSAHAATFAHMATMATLCAIISSSFLYLHPW
jgi:hypothetical protein